MLLEHIGLNEASDLIISALERTLADRIMTKDLARLSGDRECYGTTEFVEQIILRFGL